MASNDPQFEASAADSIALYMAPPQHAVIVCIGEKPAVQALDHLDPLLPLSPGRPEKHGFSVLPARNTRPVSGARRETGRVYRKTARRHVNDDFAAFSTDIVERTPRLKEI
jgi:hypothetical protein